MHTDSVSITITCVFDGVDMIRNNVVNSNAKRPHGYDVCVCFNFCFHFVELYVLRV